MSKKKDQKKQAIDAKLLADAVIELNISRRSVGLYPGTHPITRQSLGNAFGTLRKIFEIRSSITLGVAKDVLMVDDYTLDKKNPVYREFAGSLHDRGIASVTFSAGLEEEELLSFHELISDSDLPAGQALLQLDQYKRLRHIRMNPVDASRFTFVEGVKKKPKDSGRATWEEYVFALLEGRLAGDGAEGVILNIPPDDLAALLNNYTSVDEQGYDRVITTYLSRKGRKGLNRESLNRFMSLVENLNPGLREQFLSRAFQHPLMNQKETAELLDQITPDDMNMLMDIFQKQVNMPESLRNLVDKLSAVRGKAKTREKDISRVDDIELGKEVIDLFHEDRFSDFIDNRYQKDLENILRTRGFSASPLLDEWRNALSPAVLDREFTDVVLELLSIEDKKLEDHKRLLGRIPELTDVFLDTGRLSDVYHIYSTIKSRLLSGAFIEENSRIIEDFFHSEQFIARVIEAFLIWGREHRESSIGLARSLKDHLMKPLFEALDTEERIAQRKFLISLIVSFGKDAVKDAVKRIDDERWFVTRNMIYIIRECQGKEYIHKIRPLTRHKNNRISFEAIKTLAHFKTPDAFTRLKSFLDGKNPTLKVQAIKLFGTYRIREAVPYLLEMLKKPDPFGSGQHFKPFIIKTLGQIGDPGVLQAFRTIIVSRSLIYKGANRQLKREVIRSLENYRPEDSRPLLDIALSSEDKQLRAEARKLLSRRGHV